MQLWLSIVYLYWNLPMFLTVFVQVEDDGVGVSSSEREGQEVFVRSSHD